jgi:hypothetical protein
MGTLLVSCFAVEAPAELTEMIMSTLLPISLAKLGRSDWVSEIAE